MPGSLTIGGTYRTRGAGDALVTERFSWPLRMGGTANFFQGVLLASGKPARWEPSGAFYGESRNDPYDIVLT